MRTRRFRTGWRLAKPYVRRFRWAYVWGVLLLLATNGFALAIPRLLQQGIDALTGLTHGDDLRRVWWAAGGIVVAAVLQAVTRVGSRWVIFRVGRDAEYLLRQRSFQHLLALEPAYFASQRRGDLVSRLANDIGNVRLLFGFGVLNLVNTTVAYVAATTMMLLLSPTLTGLALAPLPLILWFLSRYGVRLHHRFLRAQERLGELSAFAQEALAGFEVVKGFAQEEGFQRRFEEVNDAVFAANVDLAKVRALMAPLMVFMSGFGMWMVLYFGGREVIAGTLTLGEFVAFQAYLGMLVWPTMALGWLANVLERGLASLMRVEEVLARRPKIADAPDARSVRLRGALAVELIDVEVSSDHQRFRFVDVAFAAEPGQRLAVVGRTGAGKTQLLRVLLRLVEVPRGVVRYDGHDLRSLALSSLRAQIAYAPGEPFLFGRTVREVVTIGTGVESDERIWEALERAAIADEVRTWPAGLTTPLGDRGVRLSGGQRQRLMLARIFLTDPRYLYLDDPLSALDFATAARVEAELRRFAAGRTVIWVTHRLTGMAWFDEVLLLDGGRLVARGDHERLRQEPLYAAMLERQALLQALEAEG